MKLVLINFKKSFIASDARANGIMLAFLISIYYKFIIIIGKLFTRHYNY